MRPGRCCTSTGGASRSPSATVLVVLAWLPPGVVRVAFALGWCLPVLRGALARPAGGFLIGADAPGWSFLAGSLVLLVAALVTVAARLRGRAEDPGVRDRRHLNSPRGEEPQEH